MVSLDLDLVVKSLIEKFESGIYFIIIATENGVVEKSYINEEEFNKSLISLNVSQIYETAEEITDSIGIHEPDFNISHSDNFYIMSIKVLQKIIILLMEDQIEIAEIFKTVNNCIK